MAYQKNEFSESEIQEEMTRIKDECQCNVQSLPNLGVFLLTYMSAAQKVASKMRFRSKEVGADDMPIGISDRFTSRRLPNDPEYDQQWSLSNLPNDADINMQAGWNEYLSDKYCENSSRSDVVVAVIDTGVDYNHPDLIDMMWRNPNEIPDNGIDDDNNGIIDDIHGATFGQSKSGDPMDNDGHGTHCAGVIAAKENNGQGISGVASHSDGKVKIMAIKGLTEDDTGEHSGTFSALLEGLEYAIQHGATISSNSWGSFCNETFCPNASQEVQNVWKTVLRNNPNHLLIAAAGNSNKLIGTNYIPLNCGLQEPNMLCVASSTLWNEKSSYSNYGDGFVQVFAPGDNIYSTYLYSTLINYRLIDYSYLSGTSMACPHVSGLAALIRTMRSDMNAYEVRNLIESNVQKKNSYSGLVSSGGIIDGEKTILAARKEGTNFNALIRSLLEYYCSYICLQLNFLLSVRI